LPDTPRIFGFFISDSFLSAILIMLSDILKYSPCALVFLLLYLYASRTYFCFILSLKRPFWQFRSVYLSSVFIILTLFSTEFYDFTLLRFVGLDSVIIFTILIGLLRFWLKPSRVPDKNYVNIFVSLYLSGFLNES